TVGDRAGNWPRPGPGWGSWGSVSGWRPWAGSCGPSRARRAAGRSWRGCRTPGRRRTLRYRIRIPPGPPPISFGGMNSRNRISALVMPVLVLALAACGEDPPQEEAAETSGSASAPEGAEAGGDGFCDTVAEVSAHFGRIEHRMTAGSVQTAASAAEARTVREAACPPAV